MCQQNDPHTCLQGLAAATGAEGLRPWCAPGVPTQLKHLLGCCWQEIAAAVAAQASAALRRPDWRKMTLSYRLPLQARAGTSHCGRLL